MKKIFSLSIAIAMLLCLCACSTANNENNTSNNQVNYVGSYTQGASMLAAVSEPYRGSTLYKDEIISGTMKITLNADGTGTMHFSASSMPTFTNKAQYDEMCTGTLTWTVDGNYVNITFNKVTYADPENPFFLCDTKREISYTDTFELKGAQLIDITDAENCYTKEN